MDNNDKTYYEMWTAFSSCNGQYWRIPLTVFIGAQVTDTSKIPFEVLDHLMTTHAQMVEAAILNGDPVPREVLAQYGLPSQLIDAYLAGEKRLVEALTKREVTLLKPGNAGLKE